MSSLHAAPAARIVITGATGVGKTTTGEALARLLNWTFLDLDELVTDGAAMSAADIFATEGEEGWRRRESDALARALLLDAAVIATGAGAFERLTNRDMITDAGAWTIALLAEPQVAFDRIVAAASAAGRSAGESRPMLAVGDPLVQIRALHERRAPMYALANDQIDANGAREHVVARALAGFVLSGRMPAGETITQVRQIPLGVGYDAVTGWGALACLPTRLKSLGLPPRLGVITDSSVGALYGDPLVRLLRSEGFDPAMFTVPAGEASKSRANLDAIHDWLAERRTERGEALLALGGGVVGDLAGFAAATWLRGVPLIQLPTSLLAQVDASIGGKVAIDHPLGKNLIGSFYQPRLVIADTATLLTLPERSCVEGWAEVIKHGIALDADAFAMVERDAEHLLAMKPASITSAVAGSVAIKAGVVAEDEREREGGRRGLLNFGHTLGHAIETVTGYSAWLHGEAVSAGMVFAARLGVRLGVTPPEVASRLEALLIRFGLPTRLSGLRADDLLRAAMWDKKARGGRVRWVLVTGLGASILADSAPEDALRATLTDLDAER